MDDIEKGFQEWLETRPESVRKLAAEFPLGSSIINGDDVFYLLGYTENDMLIISDINPGVDYEGALENTQYVCASHARDA
jgi:hypothetical protein